LRVSAACRASAQAVTLRDVERAGPRCRHAKALTKLTLEAFEEIPLNDAPHRHAGNRKAVAGELDINPSTLYRKMKALDIPLPENTGRTRVRR